MVATFDHRSALLVSELTGFVAQEAMKTAGRENPNRWANCPGTPSTWRGRSEQSRSIEWAGSKKNSGRRRSVFFLTSPFIELTQIDSRGMAHHTQDASSAVRRLFLRARSIDAKNQQTEQIKAVVNVGTLTAGL